MRLIFVFILLSLSFVHSFSQTKVFNLEEFAQLVEEYHPLAKQAKLQIDKGNANLRMSRGGFDPYLSGDLNQKYFDQRQYYSLIGSGLKIPTWYGIELKAGYEQNQGVFLNPEDVNPANGLIYSGISASLAQGLFIDKRRAVLQQAKLFNDYSTFEQQKLLNNLFYDAVNQYWQWVSAWNKYLIFEETLLLSRERLNAVKRNFELGEEPAIDTLEAYIQVQNQKLSKEQFLLLYKNESLALSNYLWFENNTPLEITDSLVPPSIFDISFPLAINNDSLNSLIREIENIQPELKLFEYKLNYLDIERKLKLEALKPSLNVNYNFLTEPVGTNVLGTINQENYKWGVNFSFPIFLREERGNLKLTQIKIQETNFEFEVKKLEFKNKVKQYFNEQVNYQDQISLYNEIIKNYTKLYEAEKQKFNAGESSLFVVNTRETFLANARIKQVDLYNNYFKAINSLNWTSSQYNYSINP